MKIALCDDNQLDRNQILNYILQYADKLMLDIEVNEFSSGEELLLAYKKSAYKIVFLDIYMEGLSGVEVAYKIRAENKDCIIIFTTTSPDFMTEGFNVGAVHYLLKPITYVKVEEALTRCERLFSEIEKYLCVTVDRRNVKIRFKDMLYAEVFGKLVLIHTSSEIYRTYTPLLQIAEMLKGDPFLQCHRCYIVNMNYISGVFEDNFKLDNGEKIPIRRKGRQELKDEYSRYFLNSLRRH